MEYQHNYVLDMGALEAQYFDESLNPSAHVRRRPRSAARCPRFTLPGRY